MHPPLVAMPGEHSALPLSGLHAASLPDAMQYQDSALNSGPTNVMPDAAEIPSLAAVGENNALQSH